MSSNRKSVTSRTERQSKPIHPGSVMYGLLELVAAGIAKELNLPDESETPNVVADNPDHSKKTAGPCRDATL